MKVLSFFKLEKIKYRTLYRVPASYVLVSASQVNDGGGSTRMGHSMFDNWKHSILFVTLTFEGKFLFQKVLSYHVIIENYSNHMLEIRWKRVSFFMKNNLICTFVLQFWNASWTSCYVDLKIKNVSRRFPPESYWICTDHKNY